MEKLSRETDSGIWNLDKKPPEIPRFASVCCHTPIHHTLPRLETYLPVFLGRLGVVRSHTDGRVETKGLVQVVCLTSA